MTDKLNEDINTEIDRSESEGQFETLVGLQGNYDIIYADPPWRYNFSLDNSDKIENHYPTMSIDELKTMKVPASKNCILFLWATAPKLKEAMELIEAWGFEYKTHAIWDKKWIGMGYWFRGRHELLMVATKGKVSPPDKKQIIESIFDIKRSEHSKKPPFIREKINEWYPTKTKLEMFARPDGLFVKQEFAGWHVWGNQC